MLVSLRVVVYLFRPELTNSVPLLSVVVALLLGELMRFLY